MKYLASCIALFIGALLVHPANAASSVWKISKGENYFYLGGTIHVLSLADHPLPAEFTTAYRDADTLIFETDMSVAESAETQTVFLEALRYHDGRSLADQLEPETYDRLKRYLDSRYLPIANFSEIQPWGISMMISMIEYQRLGMEPEYGVDAYFYRLATAEGKETLGLETMEDQLEAFRSMEGVDPNDIINYTLRDLKLLPQLVDSMKKTWRSGNVEDFSNNPLSLQLKTDFPRIYTALVVKRNNAWMTKLVTLTDDASTEFVLVGALHLNDDVGLLNQLEERGFGIERL